MEKLSSILFTVFFLSTLSSSLGAQTIEKKEPEKTSTLDTWRQALPQNEQPAYTLPPAGKRKPETADSPARVKKLIAELEGKFMTALQNHDAAALDTLLAFDFAPAGILTSGPTADKPHFIDWAVKSFQLKAYTVGQTEIRVFPGTALVTTGYQRQASIAGAPADGEFVVTDVWIERDQQWQMVSHHLSQEPKP